MRIITLFLFIGVIVSCKRNKQAQETFDYGKVENGVYSNTFFDFSIPVPPNWVVQNQEQMEETRQLGDKYIASKNERLASQLKSVDYATLFSVFKYRKDTMTGKFNPSMMLLAENISKAPGVTSPTKYFEQSQKLMRQSGIDYDIKPGFDRLDLGGKEFARMETAIMINGLRVNQAYYCTLIDDYAFLMLISFHDEEQETELREALSKIKFK